MHLQEIFKCNYYKSFFLSTIKTLFVYSRYSDDDKNQACCHIFFWVYISGKDSASTLFVHSFNVGIPPILSYIFSLFNYICILYIPPPYFGASMSIFQWYCYYFSEDYHFCCSRFSFNDLSFCFSFVSVRCDRSDYRLTNSYITLSFHIYFAM